ncbi:hypothetical protein HYU07_03090 [Candidatus Woesearchaeota archaeon]|nr:hypothetical protein [Candidatus Woesearchaeota archaeon]
MAEENEDYDLMPHRELMNLKRQVDEIKQNPIVNAPSGKELMNSVNDLNRSVGGLLELFKSATDEMRLEDKDQDLAVRKIDPILEKLDKVIEQNKLIAEGLVSISDMIEDFISKQGGSKPQAPPPIPRMNIESEELPAFSPSLREAPFGSQAPRPMDISNLPPPPSFGQQKKRPFGF